MVRSDDYQALKDLYERSLECLDRIGVTKKTRREECLSWQNTQQLNQTIIQLKVLEQHRQL